MKQNRRTAHWLDWETAPWLGFPPIIYVLGTQLVKTLFGYIRNRITNASKISISGELRPTYVPSLWTGPGWDSPLQVHLDSLCELVMNFKQKTLSQHSPLTKLEREEVIVVRVVGVHRDVRITVHGLVRYSSYITSIVCIRPLRQHQWQLMDGKDKAEYTNHPV